MRTALKSLKNQGKVGERRRGDISLLRATATPVDSGRWFEAAEKSYLKAANNIPVDHFSRTVPAIAKSLIRLGELPMIRSLVTGAALSVPGRMSEQAESAYRNTIQVGTWLSRILECPGRSPADQKLEVHKNAANALCMELGVLALTQRIPVHYGIANTWVATSSLLSNTTDTNPNGVSRRGKWDVSIWSRAETARFDIHRTTHRVRLQTSSMATQYDQYRQGNIQVIDPARDLDVYGIPERYIGSQILHDCMAEIHDPLHAAQARRALNDQTERLLEILQY